MAESSGDSLPVLHKINARPVPPIPNPNPNPIPTLSPSTSSSSSPSPSPSLFLAVGSCPVSFASSSVLSVCFFHFNVFFSFCLCNIVLFFLHSIVCPSVRLFVRPSICLACLCCEYVACCKGVQFGNPLGSHCQLRFVVFSKPDKKNKIKANCGDI